MKKIIIIMLIIFIVLLVGCIKPPIDIEECERIAKMDYKEYNNIGCTDGGDRLLNYDCTCYINSECREHSCSGEKQGKFYFDIK